MQAVVREAGAFKRIVEAVKESTATAVFIFSSGGVSLHSMDESHIALILLNLSPEFFESYSCKQPREIAINTNLLLKLVKGATNDSRLLLIHEDGGSTLKILTDCEGSQMRTGEISLLNVEFERITAPKATFTFVVPFPTKIFSSVVREASAFAEALDIEVTASTINFVAKGQEVKLESKFENGVGVMEKGGERNWLDSDASNESVSAPDLIRQQFVLRYLNKFLSACPLSDKVKICLSEAFPLKLVFPLESSTPEVLGGELCYYLAARVAE